MFGSFGGPFGIHFQFMFGLIPASSFDTVRVHSGINFHAFRRQFWDPILINGGVHFGFMHPCRDPLRGPILLAPFRVSV